MSAWYCRWKSGSSTVGNSCSSAFFSAVASSRCPFVHAARSSVGRQLLRPPAGEGDEPRHDVAARHEVARLLGRPVPRERHHRRSPPRHTRQLGGGRPQVGRDARARQRPETAARTERRPVPTRTSSAVSSPSELNRPAAEAMPPASVSAITAARARRTRRASWAWSLGESTADVLEVGGQRATRTSPPRRSTGGRRPAARRGGTGARSGSPAALRRTARRRRPGDRWRRGGRGSGGSVRSRACTPAPSSGRAPGSGAAPRSACAASRPAFATAIFVGSPPERPMGASISPALASTLPRTRAR